MSLYFHVEKSEEHTSIHTYIHAVCLCVDRDLQKGRGVQSRGGSLCYPLLIVIVVI